MGVWTPGPGSTSGNDTYIGDDAEDLAFGGAGDDILEGRGNNDFLVGQDGNDTILLGEGNDSGRGERGNDTIDGGAGLDIAQFRFDNLGLTSGVVFSASAFNSGAASQTLADGLGGIDTLLSIEGLVINGSFFNDSLTGSNGFDQISSVGGNDFISTLGGDDIILDGPGNLTAFGGDGDDRIIINGSGIDQNFNTVFGSGFDTVDGGRGIDSVSIDFSFATGAATLVLNGTTLTASAPGVGVNGTWIESVSANGGAFNDTFTGGAFNDVFGGGEGDDTLNGGGGDDTLLGGPGADILNGGEGRDRYQIAFWFTDGFANNSIDLSARDVSGATQVVDDGEGGTDTLISIEGFEVFGGNGADTIIGSAGHDLLFGGRGDDVVDGGAGDDVFSANSSGFNVTLNNNGVPVLFPNDGADTYIGGAGFDTLSFGGNRYALTIDMVAGTATSLSSGTDTFSGFEAVIGGWAADTITGTDNADTLDGQRGDDTLNGAGGDDILIGGSERDTLLGGAGADRITPGAGIDAVDGGDGDDIIVIDQNGSSTEVLNGGAGFDTLLFQGNTLPAGTFTSVFGMFGVVLQNIEAITLTQQQSAGFLFEDLANLPDGLVLTGSGDANVDFLQFIVSGPGAYSLARLDTFVLNNWLQTGDARDFFQLRPGNSTVTFSYDLSGSMHRDSISGAAGNDILRGFDGDDTLTGGRGIDQYFGGDGYDLLVIDSVGGGDSGINTQPNFAAEVFDGGEGVDHLVLRGSFDFTGVNIFGNPDPNLAAPTLIGVEALTLANGTGGFIRAFDTFYAQLGAAPLIRAGDRPDGVDIFMSAPGAFSAANFVFEAWDAENDFFGIFGTLGADTITGSAVGDFIDGRPGADTINGGDGDDVIYGDDSFLGDGATDILNGGAGNDYLDGGEGADQSFGGAGDDTIATYSGGWAAGEIADGGDGVDTLEAFFGESGPLEFWTGTVTGFERLVIEADGSGTVFGIFSAAQIATGLAPNLEIDIQRFAYFQSSPANLEIRIFGPATNGAIDLSGWTFVSTGTEDPGDPFQPIGWDAATDLIRIIAAPGATAYTGSSQTDMVAYQFSVGVQAYMTNPGANTGDAVGHTFSGVEQLAGTAAADGLGGDALNNTLFGLAGDDFLFGDAGDDVLVGGAGNDFLDGQGGIDTVSYIDAAGSVTAFLADSSLNAGDAVGDIFFNVENLTGSIFGDLLGANDGNNTLSGLGGDDLLSGGGGDDVLLGGSGNDLLFGGLGADLLDGGDGQDVANYTNSEVGLVINMTNAAASTGLAAGDTFVDVENVWASLFNDTIVHSDISGQVYGFDGDDVLIGNGGDDNFYGGLGADLMTFGQGADTIFYLRWDPAAAEGGDTITDFQTGIDRIFVSRFFFGFGGIAGGAAALTSADAGFYTGGATPTDSRPSFIYNQASGQLFYDADGNGIFGAPVLLATLAPGATLALGDIWTA